MQYILVLIFDIFLFQSFIVRILPPIMQFEEVLTIIFYILMFFISVNKYKNRGVLLNRERKMLRYLLLFLLVGCISTYLYNQQSSFIGILKDILAVSKCFISYVAMLIIFQKVDKEVLLLKIVKRARFYISIIFIFCIINLFFDIGMGHGFRYGIRVYKFLYTHPTYLAFSIVILISILIANGEDKDKKYIFQAIIILISTFRSKAIVFVLAYFLINIYLRFSKKVKVKYLIFIMAVGLFAVRAKIMDYFSGGLYAARPALYLIGIKIMRDYFPFGTGFCTFASSLSGEYYSLVYLQYGINMVSGLNVYDYSYMSDTFWPYIYGQFGITGLVLFVLLLWNIYKALENRYSYSKNKLKAVNLIFFYLLFASTAEAIFIDVTGQFALIVLAIFLGNNKPEENTVI